MEESMEGPRETIPTQILGPLSPPSDPTPPKRGPANE